MTRPHLGIFTPDVVSLVLVSPLMVLPGIGTRYRQFLRMGVPPSVSIMYDLGVGAVSVTTAGVFWSPAHNLAESGVIMHLS